jgi:hypothetical protein
MTVGYDGMTPLGMYPVRDKKDVDHHYAWNGVFDNIENAKIFKKDAAALARFKANYPYQVNGVPDISKPLDGVYPPAKAKTKLGGLSKDQDEMLGARVKLYYNRGEDLNTKDVLGLKTETPSAAELDYYNGDQNRPTGGGLLGGISKALSSIPGVKAVGNAIVKVPVVGGVVKGVAAAAKDSVEIYAAPFVAVVSVGTSVVKGENVAKNLKTDETPIIVGTEKYYGTAAVGAATGAAKGGLAGAVSGIIGAEVNTYVIPEVEKQLPSKPTSSVPSVSGTSESGTIGASGSAGTQTATTTTVTTPADNTKSILVYGLLAIGAFFLLAGGISDE